MSTERYVLSAEHEYELREAAKSGFDTGNSAVIFAELDATREARRSTALDCSRLLKANHGLLRDAELLAEALEYAVRDSAIPVLVKHRAERALARFHGEAADA